MNAELMRLLENILRRGVVEQISADKKAVRVRSGRLLTTWIAGMSPAPGRSASGCHPPWGAGLDRLPGRQP